MKVFLTLFLILVLTSCSISISAGKPNNSSQITTLTAQVATLTAQVATPTIQVVTPTTQIATLTTCLQYGDASQWSARVANFSITSQSREAVIEILLTVWLTHFTCTNVSEEIRLEKFTIDSIKVVDSPNLPESYKADFIAKVTYSVKPTIALSYHWIAGDGIVGDDGWVRYKRNYIGIINAGDFYEIRIWGNCPTC